MKKAHPVAGDVIAAVFLWALSMSGFWHAHTVHGWASIGWYVVSLIVGQMAIRPSWRLWRRFRDGSEVAS